MCRCLFVSMQDSSHKDTPTLHNNHRKTASLGEMIQELKPLGVDVPGGFGVSSTAYDAVLDRYELRERLQLLLHDIDVTNLDDLADRGRQARQMVVQAGLPPDVRMAIENSYEAMCEGDKPISVAVRSSATAEDLPTASFAGQQVRNNILSFSHIIL